MSFRSYLSLSGNISSMKQGRECRIRGSFFFSPCGHAIYFSLFKGKEVENYHCRVPRPLCSRNSKMWTCPSFLFRLFFLESENFQKSKNGEVETSPPSILNQKKIELSLLGSCVIILFCNVLQLIASTGNNASKKMT